MAAATRHAPCSILPKWDAEILLESSEIRVGTGQGRAGVDVRPFPEYCSSVDAANGQGADWVSQVHLSSGHPVTSDLVIFPSLKQ